jgi:hypothetical protein
MSNVQGAEANDDTRPSKYSEISRYHNVFSDPVGNPEWNPDMLTPWQLARWNVIINGCKADGDSRFMHSYRRFEGA